MREEEPSRARFLGWRGWEGDGIAEPALQAIWSDHSALERTDGFNLGSWKNDCVSSHARHNEKLEPMVALSKADVVRPRVVKVLRATPTVPPVTCPKGLVQALEAMQKGEGLAAASPRELQPTSPGRKDRSVWIGARKPRLMNWAQLARLETEEPAAETETFLAVPENEARAALAELGDPELGRICRGSVPVVQQELERQNLERAQMRKRLFEEEAQRGRELAARFRQKREAEAAKEQTPQPEQGVRSFAEIRELERAERSERLARAAATCRRASCSASPREEKAGNPREEAHEDSDSGLGTSSESEGHVISERSKRLRRRIRDAAINGIREKKKYVDRMHRKRRYREACWQALPKQERAAIETVFKLHCDKEYMTITVSSCLDALRDLGLRGRSMIERTYVEKAVSSIIKDLISVEEQGIHGAWGAAPKGSPQIWWRAPHQNAPVAVQAARSKAETARDKLPARSASKRRASSIRSSLSQQRTSTTKEEKSLAKELAALLQQATVHPTGIPLEAFGSEVIPAARWELFEQRTEPHFRLFVKEMEASRSPSGISFERFEKLVSELGLDKAKGPLPPLIKRDKQKVGPDATLDLEMVHVRLLQLEERSARAASAREWAVAKSAKVNDKLFRQYRPELLWIYDMFNAHDEEHSGFLEMFDVRRLLKYMGLEPYERRTAPQVEEFLKQVDQNHDDEIELVEFLELLGHCRKLMSKRRKSDLQNFFFDLDLDGNECLGYDQIVAALAQEGLLRTRGEYAMAQKLLDEEFDLSSVLRTVPQGDDSPAARESLVKSPPSPSMSPRRTRQRMFLMADDPGRVDFNGFSIVYQRVWERLASIKGERVLQAAKAQSVNMTELSDIQAAFDTADWDGDGLLSRGEVREVLRMLLARQPDEQVLRSFLGEDKEALTDIFEVLKMTKVLAAGTPLVHLSAPFTLAWNVPFKKQQELLRVWPISDTYIQNLDAHELMEMLSNFLAVKPDQNLREMAFPIGSFRKLREFAKRQAERAKEHTRF